MKLLSLSAAFIAALAPVSAHVSVGGDRTLNGGNPIDGQTVTNDFRTVSSSFGWADATDDDWGDSHRLTAFKFTLATPQTVAISVSRRNAIGQSGAADLLLPAFSLYTAPAFVSETHDASPVTMAYLSGTGGPFKEGALVALSPWKIYNDNGTEMFFDVLIGHAADGTSANYGSALGINGDGTADGFVDTTFGDLAAGDYYLFVGGANYSAQSLETATYPTYGITVVVSAVPEPTISFLFVAAALGLALKRKPRSRHDR